MKPVKRSQHVSAASLRALGPAGFIPCGVVFGNSAMHIARPVAIGVQSRLSAAWRGWEGDDAKHVPVAILEAQRVGYGGEIPENSFRNAYPCPHGRGRRVRRTQGHFTGFNFELPGPGATMGQNFAHALDLLVQRALERGAHGVIDVRAGLEGDAMLHGLMSVTLAGTAVSLPGAPLPPRPFTTTLSAQGFVKLLAQGLVPTSIGFGAALLSAWTGCAARVSLDSGYATEVDQLADLITDARDLAAERMHSGCGSCSVILDVSLTHTFTKAAKTDYRVAAWVIGSAAKKFSGSRSTSASEPVVVLRHR